MWLRPVARLGAALSCWAMPHSALAHGSPYTDLLLLLLQWSIFVVPPLVAAWLILRKLVRKGGFDPTGDVRRLEPGVSTVGTVREVMGLPAHEWREADGGRTWEFTRTRARPMTLMLRFGPEGLLMELREVLPHEQVHAIRQGMTEDAVRRLLGSPDDQRPEAGGGLRWEYAGRYAGGTTHVLRFSPARTLEDLRELVAKDHFAEVTTGMGRHALELLLGSPDEVIVSGTPTLCWRYEKTPGVQWEFRATVDFRGVTHTAHVPVSVPSALDGETRLPIVDASTADHVRALMGRPSHAWEVRGQGVTWEFTRYRGTPVTYVLRFGRDGVLRELRELRPDRHFDEVVRGMSQQVVRDLLGSPDQQGVDWTRKTQQWWWKRESMSQGGRSFLVVFNFDGEVVETTTSAPAA